MGVCCSSNDVERNALQQYRLKYHNQPPRCGERVPFRVIEVVDGDTVHGSYFAEKDNLDVTFCISVRFDGIDCPEKNTIEGMWIRDQLKPILENKVIDMQILKWDTYGGRIEGIPFYKGTDLCQFLLREKLARRYDGRKKKEPWTEEQLNIIRKHKGIRM